MKHQQGFTLIELIVVIVILGILAATALPKFADLQSDARLAKINGARAAVQAASALAHSTSLTQNLAAASAVTMDGVANNVAMANFYPTMDGIWVAANLGTDYASSISGSTINIQADAQHTACVLTYTEAATASAVPAIGAPPLRTSC